jgi:hypothetical protein
MARRRLWWILLALSLCWHCAPPAAVYAPARVPTHVHQREEADCAIAALAMLADRSWESVEKVRMSLGIDRTDGLQMGYILAIAFAMEIRLEHRNSMDFGTEEGILVFEHYNRLAHAVYVYRGVVYDPLEPQPEPYVIAQQRWRRIVYALVRVWNGELTR